MITTGTSRRIRAIRKIRKGKVLGDFHQLIDSFYSRNHLGNFFENIQNLNYQAHMPATDLDGKETFDTQSILI